MTKPPLLYCATDKEIYDALMSARQQFTQPSLLDLARKRGIFYSADSSREQLINELSLQIFGFEGVSAIQDEFERSGRGEKTSSMRLNASLSMEALKKAASVIAGEFASEGDRINSYSDGKDLSVDVKYEELDLSRTRLRQRQKREAKIAVRVESDHSIVTFPSTEKARLVAQNLVGRAIQEAKTPVAIEEIDLSSINDHALRTSFFQRLVTEIAGFTLEDVVKVKVDYNAGFAVAAQVDPTLSPDLQDDLEEEAAQEMLSVVRAMILHGQSLLASSEYQNLKK